MEKIQDNNKITPPGRPDAKNAIKGNLLILIATLFFGVNIPVVKFLDPEWLTSDDITVFRIIGGAVLFWIASAFVHPDRIARSDMPRVLLGGGLGLFAFIFLFNLSLRYANPIDVSIIMTLPPVFVVLYNAIFRHTRPSWPEAGGIVLGLAGAVIVIVMHRGTAHSSNALLGNLLALASSVCYAFYLIVLEGPTHRYRPISVLRWVFLAAAVPTLFLLGKFTAAPLFHARAGVEAWLMIAFVVTCPTFLAYLMVNPAIKLIGSELVSIYQYLVPVFATIASVILKLATLEAMQVVAMVVIVAGMVLTNLAKRRKKQS